MTSLRSEVTIGDCVGILGGGQLGRLLCVAAARLGLRTHVYCSEADCPAAQVAGTFTHAAYDDEAALIAFGKSVAVVTYEFENVPADTVRILNSCGTPVAPGALPLATAQDRLLEKQFVQRVGGRTPLYHPVDSLEDLRAGLDITGTPAILKTRRFGYDGKGQTRIGNNDPNLSRTWDDAVAHAWEAVGARPSILEAFVPFVCEISVIGARGRDGDIRMFDPAVNEHSDGILHRSTAPAPVSPRVVAAAQEMTRSMLEALDYVGVIGVEFFVLDDGSILVNEFAPRVHNSGHWTEAACVVSQFEQQIRAVCGWPLGEVTRHSDAEMHNLLGDEIHSWPELVAQLDTVVNVYGKAEARPGRKMGHYTRVRGRKG